MKTYNSRTGYANIGVVNQQLQKYEWNDIANDATVVLEIRPGTGGGYIREIKIMVPGVTNFDARLSQALDSTVLYANEIDVDTIKEWRTQSLSVLDMAVDTPFHSAKKSRKNELEDDWRYDSTTATFPVILLSLRAYAGVFTNIQAEIVIEGVFGHQNNLLEIMPGYRWPKPRGHMGKY